MSARRYVAVTTCHAGGYEAYGRTMAQNFVEHWPDDVPLLLYHEGFVPDIASPQVIARDLLAASPELVAFKTRHADNPRAHGKRKPFRRLKLGGLSIPLPVRTKKASYRWNAVRFSHKAFAVFHAARHTDADVLIWIDADTRFFADIDHAELEAVSPPDAMLSCLRRPKFTESGFVTYNLRHPGIRPFLEAFERYYTADTVFGMREYHDCHLFDAERERAEKAGTKVHDIGEGIGWQAEHVLINSRLGRFMDHMKGDGRKVAGKSRADDLVAARPESYWQGLN